jgi:hypothetical protein
MSRWFRHYAGMVRDEKLVSAALKSRQSVERVVWVWGAILESATEIDDNGRYELDQAEVAYFLRADEGDIAGIVAALSTLGRIADGVVVKWGDRQFQSDKSKGRVAAFRERKRAQAVHPDDVTPSRNGDVTLQQRYGNPPETETETDIPLANANGAKPDSDKQFWDSAKAYLGPKGSLIGKWCKEYGQPETARAITAAQLERAADPVSFVIGALRKGARAGETANAMSVPC